MKSKIGGHNCHYLRTIETAVQILQVNTEKEHAGKGHLKNPQVPLKKDFCFSLPNYWKSLTDLELKQGEKSLGSSNSPFTRLAYPGHLSKIKNESNIEK